MATLDFKGKALVQNYHLSVKYHELVPKKDKSLTDKVRLDDNLIIHGDNLKALKALLPTYAGRVKCIYIDPPYNTGNEGWAYNDNVNSPMMQEWLGKTVDRDDLTRHDKWLCMMMPRIKLLRELLRNDGLIFVSIDDNEAHRLQMLMDEIFGEESFIASICWRRRQSQANLSKDISPIHDHILCYRQSEDGGLGRLPVIIDDSEFSNSDNDARGPYTTMPCSNKGGARYKIITPTGKVYVDEWRFKEETYKKLVADNRIVFPSKGDGKPRYKFFRSEREAAGAIANTWWDDASSNQEANRELESILGSNVDFDNPKPVGLISKILRMATSRGSDDIVLDSFGGSGTTAHAVLAQNKEDGGKRKFILIECEDYADKITAERVRRVIKGVRGASDENLKMGLGGTFSFFELGKAIEMDSILDGKNLPSYLELARYVFYTATGEEFEERKVNEKRQFVGESKTHEVYLFYQPDMDYLKKTALTLERAEALGKIKDKRRLVFAPTKYLDQEQLDALRIDFAQLPFEIYKLAR